MFAPAPGALIEGSASRNRSAEIGKAIAIPGESLGVDVAILPTGLEGGFRVIDNPVFALAKRLHKRAVADAPDLVRLLENRAVFHPGVRVQHVLRFVVQ